MTPQEEREYVESAWTAIRNDGTRRHPDLELGGTWIPRSDAEWDEAWHAAYLFTVERQRQIAEVKEEIVVLKPFAEGRTEEALTTMPVWANDTIPALLAAGRAIQRTLLREQAALAELKRGLKEE